MPTLEGPGPDELEMAVIGGLLLEDEAEREEAFSKLLPQCFRVKILRRMFENLRNQFRETGQCDVPGAIPQTESPEAQERVVQLVKDCMDITAVKGVLAYHAAALFDRYRKRVLRAELTKLLEEIALDAPIGGIVEKLHRSLEEQEGFDKIQGAETSLDFTQSIVEYLKSLYAQEEAPLKTGIGLLDRVVGGFRPKSVNMLSGRSGMGKTDFAIYLAVKLAGKGRRVLYLTMEMPVTQIMERIASNLTGISSALIPDREAPDYGERYAQIAAALDRVNGIPLTFDGEQGLTPYDIEKKIRIHKPEVVFIDHLGLMARDPRKQPWQNAFDNSQELKRIAMRENVIFFELVQQNKDVENRSDKKGRASDLKGSDGLVNDADTIMLISADMQQGVILEGTESVDVTLRVDKSRHGGKGDIPFRWQPQFHRYIQIDNRRNA